MDKNREISDKLEIAIKTKNIEEIVKCVESNIDLNPNPSFISYPMDLPKGGTQYARGKTKITRNENIASEIYNIANDYARMQDYEFSTLVYLKCLEYDRQPHYINNLANCLKNMERFEDSLNEYEQLVTEFPDYRLGYLRLIKIAGAYNIRTRQPLKEYLTLYFEYNGQVYDLLMMIHDPDGKETEKNALARIYVEYFNSEI